MYPFAEAWLTATLRVDFGGRYSSSSPRMIWRYTLAAGRC